MSENKCQTLTKHHPNLNKNQVKIAYTSMSSCEIERKHKSHGSMHMWLSNLINSKNYIIKLKRILINHLVCMYLKSSHYLYAIVIYSKISEKRHKNIKIKTTI